MCIASKINRVAKSVSHTLTDDASCEIMLAVVTQVGDKLRKRREDRRRRKREYHFTT